MITVEFDSVGKVFDGTTALESVCFAVEDGEFIVLVGPSGCGKSTALRLVAGLESPDTGVIRIKGTDVAGVSPKNRGCAMVFQSYALYPHWTVRQNIAFPLQLRRTAKPVIEQRVTEIARELLLGDVLDRRPKALSGGQRQRVALGRAMAADPEIFLFDEPLSNLDAPLRAAMRTEIVVRQKILGKSTLYVTHDQAEALTMADRVIVLDRGRVQGIGPPEVLYRDPPNRFVASFLGRPTINLLDVQLSQSDGKWSLDPFGWPATAPSQVKQLATRKQAIQVGIRPEDIQITQATGDTAVVIAGREFLGDKVQYSLEIHGQAVTALSDATETLAAGSSVNVVPREGTLLFFDSESGQRLA